MADETDDDGADRGPIGLVLDLFVFAPLGLLAESHTIVPKLAESGRQHVDNRVQLARMVGQFAVQQGKNQAAKVVAGLRANGHASDDGAPPAPAGADVVVPDDDEDGARSVAPARTGVDDGGISEEDLAIPSYDSLAASQVVPRLDGLSTIELEAVRRYEEAHRGRRTVLGKIALLQQGS
jgi:hypothetical protein